MAQKAKKKKKNTNATIFIYNLCLSESISKEINTRMKTNVVREDEASIPSKDENRKMKGLTLGKKETRQTT